MGTNNINSKTKPAISRLDKLHFVVTQKPRNIPPVLQRRRKLSNKLWEQIELAKSQIHHTPFNVIRAVTVKDIEGNRKRIERPKRMKPWWFTADDGNLCLSVFYGSKRIELAPGKTSIATKNMADLLTALEILKSETEAGNLDGAIELASGALRSQFDLKGRATKDRK